MTPIELLKRWHADNTTVRVTGADFIHGMFGGRARVVSIDSSRVVLSTIEDFPLTIPIDLHEVTLAIPEMLTGITVTWPDGKNCYIGEEHQRDQALFRLS